MYAPPLSWSAPGDGDLPECSHDEAASPPRPRTITRVTIAGLAEAAAAKPAPREGQQQQGQGEQVLPQVLRSFHGLSQTRRFKLRF